MDDLDLLAADIQRPKQKFSLASRLTRKVSIVSAKSCYAQPDIKVWDVYPRMIDIIPLLGA